MDRRDFIRHTTLAGSMVALTQPSAFATALAPGNQPRLSSAMRWVQLAFVENDPGRYDPGFWLDYFRRVHADGALLSAGGVVAFYPTDVPLHHRSAWLGNSDPLGDMVKGCRRMNMQVILRTDPHATRQDMYDAHPDYIAVTAEGTKRRHWANPALWVTCALGPYNFDFMTRVNKEIMDRYQPDAIFSNRWAGHGICYCEHCRSNFRAFSGLDIPTAINRLDPAFRKYSAWRVERLKELWFLWDDAIRKEKPTARFIPNGFPDKLLTGKHADFFFADQQARRGLIPPWSNGKGAKELRAGLGMKTLVGIFSVGIEEEFRWKDSVQSDAEIRIWVADGVANGMLPCFVKFGALIYDKRWMETVAAMYEMYYRGEKYLKNIAPLARVAMVYSEQTEEKYGGKEWQQKSEGHALGMYHALVEARIPFEMVNDRLLDAQHLAPFKLLVLPNIAALSDEQCDQLRVYVANGGSLVATFETSLYDEEGRQRADFGLGDLFGVSFDKGVEGPMKNSYLRIKKDAATGRFHPVLGGLEDAFRIINTIHQVKVIPVDEFPSPVTLIPTYPDLPMEDVYPRVAETPTRELYLREAGKSRIAYIPGDMDRSFWQMLGTDHGTLLQNTIRWALDEDPIVSVKGPGVIDVTAWRQAGSMTVHLVNLTNPMMMKGPFRELLPIEVQVVIRIPEKAAVTGIQFLATGITPTYETKQGKLVLDIPRLLDHEIIALDMVWS